MNVQDLSEEFRDVIRGGACVDLSRAKVYEDKPPLRKSPERKLIAFIKAIFPYEADQLRGRSCL